MTHHNGTILLLKTMQMLRRRQRKPFFSYRTAAAYNFKKTWHRISATKLSPHFISWTSTAASVSCTKDKTDTWGVCNILAAVGQLFALPVLTCTLRKLDYTSPLLLSPAIPQKQWHPMLLSLLFMPPLSSTLKKTNKSLHTEQILKLKNQL